MRLCFLFFVLLLLICNCFADRCFPQEKKTLMKIKKHFGNPYHLASWRNDLDCCEWYTIGCDLVTNHVTSLSIFWANISGTIPPFIGDLSELQNLDLNHITNITGPIQPTIAKLKKLTQLRLQHLNLTGPIPAFLGQLTNLLALDLSVNSLSGAIPPELALLPNLIDLRLSRNQLSGPIPSSLAKFAGSATPEIRLSQNRLSGQIPASFSNLNTTAIDISRNFLTGDPSMLFGLSKRAQYIDLSRNNFSFDISNVVFPSGLAHFDINHNRIFGSLPKQMAQLDLQFLNVSYNRLCGPIPQGGMLQSYNDDYVYFHNKCLCGSPLPSCK